MYINEAKLREALSLIAPEAPDDKIKEAAALIAEVLYDADDDPSYE